MHVEGVGDPDRHAELLGDLDRPRLHDLRAAPASSSISS